MVLMGYVRGLKQWYSILFLNPGLPEITRFRIIELESFFFNPVIWEEVKLRSERSSDLLTITVADTNQSVRLVIEYI